MAFPDAREFNLGAAFLLGQPDVAHRGEFKLAENHRYS
jgi:hypothetical protein